MRKIYVIIFTLIIIIINCSNQKPSDKSEESQNMSILTIQQVLAKYQDRLMNQPGVVGVGIGAVKDELVIKVLVAKKTPQLEKQLPQKLEGYAVIIEETGTIRALTTD
jgi:hypothetical protein